MFTNSIFGFSIKKGAPKFLNPSLLKNLNVTDFGDVLHKESEMPSL
jgi:hypothetical protein